MFIVYWKRKGRIKIKLCNMAIENKTRIKYTNKIKYMRKFIDQSRREEYGWFYFWLVAFLYF